MVLGQRAVHFWELAHVPVEQSTCQYSVINLKTAKALGITMPQSVLLRADKVLR